MGFLSTQTIRTFYRSSPLFFPLIAFLEGFFLYDPRGYLLALILILSSVTNKILKKTLKFLMLRSGNRPYPDSYCGFQVEGTKKSTSYGMPSGHSQLIALVATLVALSYNKHDYVRYVLLMVLVLGAMAMRIYVEKCHTLAQTVVGAGFGFLLGWIVTKVGWNPFKRKSKEPDREEK